MDTEWTVVVCDTEPIAIEGMRAIEERAAGAFRLVSQETSMAGGMAAVRRYCPTVVILDKAFGMGEVLVFLREAQRTFRPPATMVWGSVLSGADALRLLQAGAQGVVRKTAAVKSIVACLRAVAAGTSWMEEELFHAPEPIPTSIRSSLTARELQVVELIEQGMKNRDIAANLGIRTGTVKIHLRHIFEKTGIRGRYGLALTGLKEKGLLSWPEEICS